MKNVTSLEKGTVLSSEDLDPDTILDQYEVYHVEFPYQVGLGKIYDIVLLEAEKKKDYFAKEYELKATGVGNRVFSKDLIESCIYRGNDYDPRNVDQFSPKYLCLDPAFYGSRFGVVICELVDGDLRVLYAEEFHRKDTQSMIDKILDLRIKYRNIKNIMVDASASEFIMDLKMYFDNQGYEYPDMYNEKIKEWFKLGREPWEMNMYIVPSPFNKRVEYTQRLKKTMEQGNFWIHESFDKLVLSLETAVATEKDTNDIDKEHQEYADICDALLALFRRIKPI